MLISRDNEKLLQTAAQVKSSSVSAQKSEAKLPQYGKLPLLMPPLLLSSSSEYIVLIYCRF